MIEPQSVGLSGKPCWDRSELRGALRQARHKWCAAVGPSADLQRAQWGLELLRGWVAHNHACSGHGLRLGIFHPLPGEPDLRPLASRVWQHHPGWSVYLPISPTPPSTLRWGPYRHPDDLRIGRYGIAEPTESDPRVKPDVLLIPLLAFTPTGHRLGYGGGYYDRTLAAWAQQGHCPLKIGVGWASACLSDAVLRPLDHDIPLDLVLTDQGWVLPESSPTQR